MKEITSRERATVLGALREFAKNADDYKPLMNWDLFHEFDPLSPEEIEKLFKRIKASDDKPVTTEASGPRFWICLEDRRGGLWKSRYFESLNNAPQAIRECALAWGDELVPGNALRVHDSQPQKRR
jgi:transposase